MGINYRLEIVGLSVIAGYRVPISVFLTCPLHGKLIGGIFVPRDQDFALSCTKAIIDSDDDVHVGDETKAHKYKSETY